MARKYRKRAIRELKSVANSAAKLGSKAVIGVSKWAVTDHSGMGNALSDLPEKGFAEQIRFILGYLIIGIIGSVITGIWVFILIAYGIPLLLEI